MFVVHPARIKCCVAQRMVTQEFLVEVLKFPTSTHAVLLCKAGGTINSRDIIWHQKAPAKGDVIGAGPCCWPEICSMKHLVWEITLSAETKSKFPPTRRKDTRCLLGGGQPAMLSFVPRLSQQI